MNTQDPSRKPRNKNPNPRAYKFAEILIIDQEGRQAVLTPRAAKHMFKRKVRARVSGDKHWLSSKDLDRAAAASERDDKKAARRFKKQQLEQDLELAKQLRRRIKTAKPTKEKVPQRQPKGAQLISPGRHSVLPNYGYAIRDRQGRIGVHPKFKYISSKTSKPGAAKRAVQYYARGAEIDANGQPMLYSNVARSVQEAATCFDHIEIINRSAQKNAKVAMTGIMPMDPRWSPKQMMKVATDWADENLGKYGLPYFIALHPPPPEGDQRNWHAHIIWSWRPVTRVGDYEWEVSENLLTSLDGAAGIRLLRERFAAHMTAMSAEVGDFDVYTSLSHAARGLPIIPQEPLYETRTRKARAGEFVPENERNHERMIASLAALLDDKLRAFDDYLAAEADALQKVMASFIRPVRVPDVPDATPAPRVTIPEEFMDVVEPLRPIDEQAAAIRVPEPVQGFSLADLQRMFAGLFAREIPAPLEAATVSDPLPDYPEPQSASTVIALNLPEIPPLLRNIDQPELPDVPSPPAPSASASVANLRIPPLEPLTPIDVRQIPDIHTPPPPHAVIGVSVADGAVLQSLQPMDVPVMAPDVPPHTVHEVPVVPTLGQLPQPLPTITPVALPDVPLPPQPVPPVISGNLARATVLDRIGERTLALIHAAIAEADSLLQRIIDTRKAAEEEVEADAQHLARPPDPVDAPATPNEPMQSDLSDSEQDDANNASAVSLPKEQDQCERTGADDGSCDPRRAASIVEVLKAVAFFKAPARRVFQNPDGSLRPDMGLWNRAGLEKWVLRHPHVAELMNKVRGDQEFFIERYVDSLVRDGDLKSAQGGASAFIAKLPRLSQTEPKAWLGTGLIEDVLIPLVTKEGQRRAGRALQAWQDAVDGSVIRANAAIEAQDWQRRWPNLIKDDLLMQLEQEAKAARLQRQAMQKAAADDATGDQGNLGTHRDPGDAQVKMERDEREKRLRVLEERRRRQQVLDL